MMLRPVRLALRRAIRIRRRMSNRDLSRDLGPHLMRDIGLDPAHEKPLAVPIPRW